MHLYSLPQTAAAFDLSPARLRYWIQSGFITPSERRGNRFYYRVGELLQIEAATRLLEGIPFDTVRRRLGGLRATLPTVIDLRGNGAVVLGDDAIRYESDVIDAGDECFTMADVWERVSECDPLPDPRAAEAWENGESEAVTSAAPAVIDAMPTVPHKQPTAYQCFVEGCDAEATGDDARAEECYERALALETSFAAAHTNLGNVLFRRGDHDGARRQFEIALEYESDQPEARYNLANILDDRGDTELAIAELRQVVARAPEFADAHYNLGRLLARVGGLSQAKKHFLRYLALDTSSAWAAAARKFVLDPTPTA